MLEKLAAWSTKLIRWDEKSIARWERTRARGQGRYVLYTGVLGWGLSMFVVMTVLSYLQRYGPVPPTADSGQIALVLLNLVIWPLVGSLFGIVMWLTAEASYRSVKGR
jgi:hypothetical protein